jgi:hypothetical protein
VTEPAHFDRQPPERSPVQRAFRALLELDRPFPDLTEDELAARVERDYGWNLTVNVGDGALFLFGAAFLTSSTILPLFLSKLEDAICQIRKGAITAPCASSVRADTVLRQF